MKVLVLVERVFGILGWILNIFICIWGRGNRCDSEVLGKFRCVCFYYRVFIFVILGGVGDGLE